MKIVDLGHDLFLIQFEKREDYVKTVEGGPWVIADHYFTIRKWSTNFRPSVEKISKTMVWVRFPELPIEYYDREFLFMLGATIGNPGRVDATRENAMRGKFARLCVEVDFNKLLISRVKIGRFHQRAEY